MQSKYSIFDEDKVVTEISANRGAYIREHNKTPEVIIMNPNDVVMMRDKFQEPVRQPGLPSKSDILDMSKPIDLMVFGMPILRSPELSIGDYLMF